MSKNRKRGKGLRRGLSVLLTFALLFGMTAGFSGPALAAESVLTPSNNGTVTAVNGGSYTISASGTYTGWRFIVPNGVTATLTVSGTLTLNNQSGGGSPIDVQAGGALNLVVNGTLSVYGQNAGNGEDEVIGTADGQGAAGGQGANAGISVPINASLIVNGSGKLSAFGGNAGSGGLSKNFNYGSGGGGGAAAGIGGNGGSGAAVYRWGSTGTDNTSDYTSICSGKAGISAGSVTFRELVKVNAYGGAGGSGGLTVNVQGSTGGGGYPAAGIGGGGGGAGSGNAHAGAGGFSGGNLEATSYQASNGLAGMWGTVQTYSGGGGGYFESTEYAYTYKSPDGQDSAGLLGGSGGAWAAGNPENRSYRGGNGGPAGSGGTINIYTAMSYIKAYNGSYITTSKNNYGENQTVIYAQAGYDISGLRTAKVTKVTSRSLLNLEAELNSKISKTILTTQYGIGIGSGAGYTESSNGTVQYGTRLDLGTLKADLHLTPSTNNGVPYILFGI